MKCKEMCKTSPKGTDKQTSAYEKKHRSYTWLNLLKDGSGLGHDTSLEYEVSDGTTYHHLETLWRKRFRGCQATRWRDELDDYWKGTIWQRIAQGRHMWKQHAEAFTQPWNINQTLTYYLYNLFNYYSHIPLLHLLTMWKHFILQT